MDTGVHDKQRLKELQALPLERKIMITQARIIEWYTKWNGQVYVSFSGGKDSSVLLHIARQCFPDIEAVFVNTGLEYPEIQKFAKSFENVTVIRPEMSFVEVIQHYGYPLISKEVAQKIYESDTAPDGVVAQAFESKSEKVVKYGGRYDLSKWNPLRSVDFKISHMCCNVMKKTPAKSFERKSNKHPILATMTCESSLRETKWLLEGCNAFNAKRPTSKPMSFWTEQDVLEYIRRYNLPIARVYGDIVPTDNGCKLCTTGCDRTGCIFCGFGAHSCGDDRFLRLLETHPRQYDYCINGGEYAWIGRHKPKSKWKRLYFKNKDGSPMTTEQIEYFVKEHRDDPRYVFERVWLPNKQGLGMAHVFDAINQVYGENFIRYK